MAPLFSVTNKTLTRKQAFWHCFQHLHVGILGVAHDGILQVLEKAYILFSI